MVTNNKMPRYLRPNVTIQYPNSAERDYYRVLRAIVRELRKYTNELLPSIKPSLKQDADSEDIINEVTARFNNSRVREAALNEVQRIISSVDNIARQNMNKAFKNCLGVDVFMSNTALLDKITSEWYASQSQLINSIVSTYTDKLGTIISNAVQRGSLYKDVYADVKHLYDITDNRAKFIARNEIGNLNAITTKTRQQEAGVNCYEWLTSRDERVRASHAAMDGNLYYWSRSTPGEINGRKVYPTPGLQPGMDYNCRCVAIPIIDTESWNMANATPDGQPVANMSTEVISEANKETRDWKKYYSLKNKESSLNEKIKDLEIKKKEAELKFITEASETAGKQARAYSSKLKEMKSVLDTVVKEKETLQASRAARIAQEMVEEGLAEKVKLSGKMSFEAVDELKKTFEELILRKGYPKVPGIEYNNSYIKMFGGNENAIAMYDMNKKTIFLGEKAKDLKSFNDHHKLAAESYLKFKEKLMTIWKDRVKKLEQEIKDATDKGTKYLREKDLRDVLSDINPPRNTVPENFAEVLKHEYGHFIHDKASEVGKLFEAKALKARKINDSWFWTDDLKGKLTASYISKDATTSPLECFAEAFTAYLKGEKIPEVLKDIVESAIKTAVKKAENGATSTLTRY